MKSALPIFVFLAIRIAASAQANPETPNYNGNVYAKAFTGTCQHGYLLYGGGGGAEGILWKGISVGGEVSYQAFSDGWGLTYFTVQPGFHFNGRKRTTKWDPFISLGLGGAISNHGGYGGTSNFGGGFNYWFKDRTALRFDVRAQAVGEEAMVVFGFGVSFR